MESGGLLLLAMASDIGSREGIGLSYSVSQVILGSSEMRVTNRIDSVHVSGSAVDGLGHNAGRSAGSKSVSDGQVRGGASTSRLGGTRAGDTSAKRN